MFHTIITKEFIEKFNALNGQNVVVNIKHAFYGSQKIKCVLHALMDGERIGLIIGDEEKYITMDELISIGVIDQEFYLKSDVMEISIKPVVK